MHLMFSKKPSGTYATAANSIRIEGKPVKIDRIYLGRVIDLEKGIFENKDRGVFHFDVETGQFGEADLSDLPKRKRGKRRMALDFGDMYVLDKFLSGTCLYRCIEESGCPNPDTMKALVAFYLLTDKPHSWAREWYESSYASILYPRADLDDRRISEYLKAIGDAGIHRNFFGQYIPRVIGDEPTAFIIDSTGAPNSVHMPITGISNHNGEIKMEVRIILVCRKSDRMPLLARYIPGNVIDSSTIGNTITQLKEYGINPEYTLIDAGYCTLENMRDLMESHIGFITRLKPNFDMYKKMLEDHIGELDGSRRVLHNDRFMRVFSEERALDGTTRKVWLHLILDEDAKYDAEKRAFKKHQAGEIDEAELNRIGATAGLFILVSTMWIETNDVIPTYFERGGIEQLIDTGKTTGRLDRVGVHSEEAYSGKLLLDFIALAVSQMLQNHVKQRKGELSSRKRKNKNDIPGVNLSAPHALFILRNQKCDVFDNMILPRERNRSVNDVYKLFGYEPPAQIWPEKKS